MHFILERRDIYIFFYYIRPDKLINTDAGIQTTAATHLYLFILLAG